jgi:hypothetical protein
MSAKEEQSDTQENRTDKQTSQSERMKYPVTNNADYQKRDEENTRKEKLQDSPNMPCSLLQLILRWRPLVFVWLLILLKV